MNKSDSIAEINKALAKFQAEVKQPLKDADNPFFKSKYVPLENVVEAISKVAPNHGLSFVQWPLNDDQGRVGVATMLMHESGEFLEFDPVFMNAEKQTPQGAGSLITYLKRYSLSAVFGITSDQDDDANDSSGNQPHNKPQSTGGTGNRASDKQLNFVKKLIKDNVSEKFNETQLHDLLKKRINTTNDIENFTAQEASAAIKYLNKSA